MKKFLTIYICLLATIQIHAQQATTILDKAAEAYQKSNGITAEFEMVNHSEKQDYTETVEGTIQMKGEKFVLEAPGMTTWFNGKTQWSYLENSEEVNVSNPSGNERRFVNPVLLLTDYKRDFTPKAKGDATVNGKKVSTIELTPNAKNDINRVILQIDTATHLPVTITVDHRNGMNSKIRITQIKTGVNQADGLFEFKSADYPDAEVIDLR